MTASFHGHVDIVRMLIEAKAQVNTQEEVHVCCSYHQKTYRTTISYPVLIYLYMSSLCFCPQDGWTALHMAAQEGKVDIMRLLTEAKAHVDIQTEVHVHTLVNVWSTDLDSHSFSDVRGESMYKECCMHACTFTCTFVDVNICNNCNISRLYMCIANMDECHVVSRSDIIHIIIQDGRTALYLAINKGHGSIVKLLLEREHADVNISKKV